jgi:hypothetical protein
LGKEIVKKTFAVNFLEFFWNFLVDNEVIKFVTKQSLPGILKGPVMNIEKNTVLLIL